MRRCRPLSPLAVLAGPILVLAACGSGTASPAEPSATSHAGHTEPATPEASEEPSPSGEEAEDASPSEEAVAEEVEVRLASSVFEPSELTIAAGTTVVFANADGYGHTVTEGTGGRAAEDPIVDEQVAASGTVRLTFDEAGSYEITCRIHPSMQMTITVEG